MALVGAFTVSQSSEASISITDASTGSFAGITTRRIYLTKFDGTTLVPAGTLTPYILWPIVDGIGDIIELEDILDKDYALSIKVDWMTGATVTSTITELLLFKQYTELFKAALTTETQARYPTILNDENFIYNKFKLSTFLEDAKISVELMNDIYKAQFALELANNMIQNQNSFF